MHREVARRQPPKEGLRFYGDGPVAYKDEKEKGGVRGGRRVNTKTSGTLSVAYRREREKNYKYSGRLYV